MTSHLQSLATVVGMATALVVLAMGNEHLLRATQVSNGVHWIYLPAGLRLCFVLVMPVQGTVAIFAASVVMASRDPSLGPGLVLASAAITAAGPALARTVALQRLGLQANLGNLTARMLWSLAALFGLFSTALHQAFYTAIGREPAWVSMWVGDTLGCLLCLYGLKGLAIAWRNWKSS